MESEQHVAYVIYKEYLDLAENRFPGSDAYEALWHLLSVLFEREELYGVPDKYKDFVEWARKLVLENHKEYVLWLVNWHEG